MNLKLQITESVPDLLGHTNPNKPAALRQLDNLTDNEINGLLRFYNIPFA